MKISSVWGSLFVPSENLLIQLSDSTPILRIVVQIIALNSP